MASKQTIVAQAAQQVAKPKGTTKGSFTYVVSGGTFRDEGFFPEITAEQYGRILRILNEGGPVEVVAERPTIVLAKG